MPVHLPGSVPAASSVDSYRYEIASLEEPEPGIWTRKYEFCNEELIRPLGPSEKPDHEEVVNKLQRHEAMGYMPLKEDIDMLGLKPVEKPIKSTGNTSVPKIDQDFFKNLGDWSAGSSNEEAWSDKNLFKDRDDWSAVSNSKTSLPVRRPSPKVRVRLGIKLVFPGGERESQTYSVHKFLSVQVFKQRMQNDLMKTTHPIALFVSPV